MPFKGRTSGTQTPAGVVEDEGDIRDLLAYNPAEGYDVRVEETGEGGLQAFAIGCCWI